MSRSGSANPSQSKSPRRQSAAAGAGGVATSAATNAIPAWVSGPTLPGALEADALRRSEVVLQQLRVHSLCNSKLQGTADSMQAFCWNAVRCCEARSRISPGDAELFLAINTAGNAAKHGGADWLQELQDRAAASAIGRKAPAEQLQLLFPDIFEASQLLAREQRFSAQSADQGAQAQGQQANKQARSASTSGHAGAAADLYHAGTSGEPPSDSSVTSSQCAEQKTASIAEAVTQAREVAKEFKHVAVLGCVAAFFLHCVATSAAAGFAHLSLTTP